MRSILWAGLALPALSLAAAASTVSPFLSADQTLDQILPARDLNGDGDTNDTGEVTVFVDAGTASGLPKPAGNVFSLTQARDGSVLFGDGDTDTVYRMTDRNGDGDANGAGEAVSGSRAAAMRLACA